MLNGSATRHPRSALIWSTFGAAMLQLVSCSPFRMDDPTAIVPTDVLTIAADSQALNADGDSRTGVVVRLGRFTPDNVDVLFKATAGSFVASDGSSSTSVTVKGGARQAQAIYLAGNRAGTVTVSASIGTVTVQSNLMLRPSLPATILLTPSKTSAKGDGSGVIDFKATLLSAGPPKVVSQGTRIEFVALDSATSVEIPDAHAIAIFDGSASSQVAYSISSRVARTIKVMATAGDSSSQVKSNPVYVVFTP
jgi:hypothetical protein